MATKPLVYLIYQDLSDAVKGLAKKTTLGRPETGTEDLSDLIAVELPVTLYPGVKGSMDVTAKTFGVFYVYCKAKSDGTLNIGAQTDLIQKVMDVFPVNGTHVTATHPTILMDGKDRTGYQVTKIAFNIRTKFNARNTTE